MIVCPECGKAQFDINEISGYAGPVCTCQWTRKIDDQYNMLNGIKAPFEQNQIDFILCELELLKDAIMDLREQILEIKNEK